MKKKGSISLARQRLGRAKEDLSMAKLLYDNNGLIASNNRAYYSIFHSMRAVLALEGVDFKRHKDVQDYLTEHYVKTEIFPRKIGHKIVQASRLREDSDYDDNFIKDYSETKNQIETAEELIKLVEDYLNKK